MSRPAERIISTPIDPVDRLVEDLKHRYRARITGDLTIPARPGRYAPMPTDMDNRLKSALRSRGIERLYSHQANAWRQIGQGRHTVIVTPTAKKTL